MLMLVDSGTGPDVEFKVDSWITAVATCKRTADDKSVLKQDEPHFEDAQAVASLCQGHHGRRVRDRNTKASAQALAIPQFT